MKLYAYKQGSKSAKALAEALGIKRIKHEGKPLKLKGTLINWGASRFTRGMFYDKILNHFGAVATASNKLQTFKALQDKVCIPEWTEDPVEAEKWLAEGFTIVSRLVLNGHSGEGIEILEPGDAEEEFPITPLYTKYVPKTQEYRVHVFQGNAFFVQRKARKKDVPDDQINWKVRNHGNGFIFAHNEGIDIGDGARQLACLAVETLGLDFGAVDLIYNKKEDKYYVLEVNCAPGLSGETLEKYKEKFEQFL